uniref:Ig-like domain-containing protein n=1 Tax=Pyxicephalus adspersus TaxID=30357 RepID=A0AAV3AG16_PYXAD|nr:TPA: hypothetical protein GDO54_014013 [Pyxicephalus adspersus]
MSGSPGESVRITCDRSGGSVAGGNYPSWYLQTLGSAPKLIVGSSSTTNQNSRPPGISDRFSGSISGGSAVLSIDRLENDDEGMNYCGLYAGSGVSTVMYKIREVRHKQDIYFL